MKIVLWCDGLMTRARIESAWKAAGAQVLKKNTAEAPDLIVIDLTARNALDEIGRRRAVCPDCDILVFRSARGRRCHQAGQGSRRQRAGGVRCGGRAHAGQAAA